MNPSHHFTAQFHIAKVEGRVFWFGDLHFKLSKEEIELKARNAIPDVEPTFSLEQKQGYPPAWQHSSWLRYD